MLRLNDITSWIARPFRNVHAIDKRLAWHKVAPHLRPTISVTSPDFEAGEALPESATAIGGGVPPTLVVGNVPPEARSLVVVCEGPDSPLVQPFVHWLLFRLEGHDMTIDREVIAVASEGRNTKLQIGYAPPNPPRGLGVHHYHFQVFALDDELPGSPDEEASVFMPPYQPARGVQTGDGRSELLESMRGHVIAWGEIVGTSEGK
jgi:Raf kinase inhibitor-like YbhB/YbcL family protein